MARLIVPGARAIERLGENPGHRRLADATGTGEQVGMSDPAGVDSVLQSAGNVFLPNHLFKGLRPKTASQDGVVSRLRVHRVHAARSILRERFEVVSGLANRPESRERLSPPAPESQNA